MNVALLWLAAALSSAPLTPLSDELSSEVRLTEQALFPGRVVEGEGVLVLPAGTRKWLPSERNSALAPGDLIRTGGNSATLELSPSWLVHAGPASDLSFHREGGVEVIELRQGTLIGCSFDGEVAASIVVPGAAAWLAPGGVYRIEVTGTQTVFRVRAGIAEVEVNGRVKTVRAGRSLAVGGPSRKLRVTHESGTRRDDLDSAAESACSQRSDGTQLWGLTGERDLLAAGHWQVIDGRRYWIPEYVAADWQPFDDGCFRHHPSLGWYFVPHEPWGWVTHHHGRWVRLGSLGWAWSPGSSWYGHRVSFWEDRRSVYWCPRPEQDSPGRRQTTHRNDRRFTHAPLADFRRRLPAKGRRVPGELVPLDRLSPVVHARRIAQPPGSLPEQGTQERSARLPGERRDVPTRGRMTYRVDRRTSAPSNPESTVPNVSRPAPTFGRTTPMPAPRLRPLPATDRKLDRERRMRDLARVLPSLKQGDTRQVLDRRRSTDADADTEGESNRDRTERTRDSRQPAPQVKPPVEREKPLDRNKVEPVKRERPTPRERVKPVEKPRPIREKPTPRPKKDEI